MQLQRGSGSNSGVDASLVEQLPGPLPIKAVLPCSREAAVTGRPYPAGLAATVTDLCPPSVATFQER